MAEGRSAGSCVPGCVAPPYTPSALARHLTPPTLFEAYLQSAREPMEVAAYARVRREVAAQVEQLMALGEHERQVEVARRKIDDEMLTFKCPRCKRAFLDFIYGVHGHTMRLWMRLLWRVPRGLLRRRFTPARAAMQAPTGLMLCKVSGWRAGRHGNPTDL